jgi:hypothetical protein
MVTKLWLKIIKLNSARDFSCVQIELVRVRDLISSSEGAEHIKI